MRRTQSTSRAEMKTARGLRFTAAIPPPEPVIGRVAKALLGSPNPYLSTAAQWHYSSLQIDLTNNTWSDTEIQKHGGVLDLINRVLGGDHADARRWLDERFGAAYAGLDYDHLDVTAGHERAAAVD